MMLSWNLLFEGFGVLVFVRVSTWKLAYSEDLSVVKQIIKKYEYLFIMLIYLIMKAEMSS